MSFRLSAAVALAAVALVSGCTTTEQEAPLPELVVAAFNSAQYQGGSAAIPTPNDLALQAAPTLPAQLAAQKALLQAFVVAGGFPSDQAVGITIPLKKLTFDPATNGYLPPASAAAALATGPVIEPASLTTVGASPTVVVLKIDVSPPAVQVVEVDVENCTTGQIALKKAKSAAGSRAWAPGRYAFAIRGGEGGVRTKAGLPVQADTAIALVWPNRDLANKELQPPGGLAPAIVARLEAVRGALWNPVDWGNPGNGTWTVTGLMAAGAGAFPAVSAFIPADQVAVLGTFEVAPSIPTAPVDSGSGIAPLPLDLLRTGPTTTGGQRTIASNPAAFGPANDGLITLDGFSTTGTIFAPVTPLPINAGTVTGASVRLYKLPPGGPPVLLKELREEFTRGGASAAALADYIAQPDALNVAQGIGGCPLPTGCSSVVGLQAGLPVSAPAVAYLPPLEAGMDYAVVITSAVKTVTGSSLQKSTVAKILTDPGFDPIVLPTPVGVSLLAGISNATANALYAMRKQLEPVIADLPNGAADVALAYTFRTQSIPGVSLQLSAAPYGTEQALAAATFVPQAVTTLAVAPAPNVAATYNVVVPTIDPISKATGALNPNQAAWAPTALNAYVAVPDSSLVVSNCPAPADALKCAPLVVFGHGLGGKRSDVAAVMSSLAARGFVVAAIDFPQHGARSWCLQDADCDDGSGRTGRCTPFPNGRAQGDVVGGVPVVPGTCDAPGFPKAAVSGQTFISSNFFRTRDALRNNLLDQSALVLALARPPSSAWPLQPAADPFKTKLLEHGILVDPSKVYWEGISLGGMAGTEVLATNPRFSRGVTSVAGATLVDVFTNAPAFQTRVNALFTGLLKPQLDAIAPGTPFTPALVDGTNASFNSGVATQYLKTVVTAKWILDPGDPLNFARHLRTSPLPNLLSPTPALQAAKDVLGQVAVGDLVVPNAFNRELFAVGGVDVVEYTSLAYPAANMHGILAFDPTVQSDAAGYLFDLTRPPAPPTQVTIP